MFHVNMYYQKKPNNNKKTTTDDNRQQLSLSFDLDEHQQCPYQSYHLGCANNVVVSRIKFLVVSVHHFCCL